MAAELDARPAFGLCAIQPGPFQIVSAVLGV
jgi:hypothetical protein